MGRKLQGGRNVGEFVRLDKCLSVECRGVRGWDSLKCSEFQGATAPDRDRAREGENERERTRERENGRERERERERARKKERERERARARERERAMLGQVCAWVVVVCVLCGVKCFVFQV